MAKAMSALATAFVASLRRISAERCAERADLEAAREQVSVLLELVAEQNKTMAQQRRTIDHQRAQLRAVMSGTTLADVTRLGREAA